MSQGTSDHSSQLDLHVMALDFGRELVAQVDDEESEFYDELVSNAASNSSSGDHALGFGVPISLETVSVLAFALGQIVLPIVYHNLRESLSRTIGASAIELEKQVTARIIEWIRSKFKNKDAIEIPKKEVEKLRGDFERIVESTKIDPNIRSRLITKINEILT